MARDDSIDPPDGAVLWVKNLFLTKAVEQRVPLRQKLIAVLRVNLLPQNPVYGERSAAASKVRQMFFEAGENGIDLRISRGSKGWKVQGQVLGSGFEHSSVTLSGSTKEFAVLMGGESGFELNNIPSGTYRLAAAGVGSEIIIEKLEI